jgi:alanine dehydrogenase
VTLPWVMQIANRGIERAARELKPIARAINIMDGEVTNRAVAETFGMKYVKRFEE